MPQVASWGKGKLCKRVDLWHLRFTKTQCKDNKLTKKCMAISDFIRLRKLGLPFQTFLHILFFIVYRLFVSSKLLLVNPILGLKFSIYSFTFMDGSIQRQGIVITKNKDIQEGDQVQIYNIGYQLYFGNKRFIS